MIINTHKLCKKGTLHWCFVYHFSPNNRVAAYHGKCSLKFKIPPQSFWISQISWCSFVTLLGTLSFAHFVYCCPDQQAHLSSLYYLSFSNFLATHPLLFRVAKLQNFLESVWGIFVKLIFPGLSMTNLFKKRADKICPRSVWSSPL